MRSLEIYIKVRKYSHPALLVLDEFALKLFKVQEAEDFYEVISQRCEKGATVITSNRSFEEWPEVFGDSLLASATIDRLSFRAHKIEIVGPSYRTERNRKNKKGVFTKGVMPKFKQGCYRKNGALSVPIDIHGPQRK